MDRVPAGSSTSSSRQHLEADLCRLGLHDAPLDLPRLNEGVGQPVAPLGLEREDLGIYAKARGMMLYDGNVYPVNAQSFQGLGIKVSFMLVIEKEGIADVEMDAVARGFGVALVHTGGKFTKDVRKLIENAQVPFAH